MTATSQAVQEAIVNAGYDEPSARGEIERVLQLVESGALAAKL